MMPLPGVRGKEGKIGFMCENSFSSMFLSLDVCVCVCLYAHIFLFGLGVFDCISLADQGK